MSSFYGDKLENSNVFYSGCIITLVTYIGILVHFKTGATVKNLQVDELLEDKPEESITDAIAAAAEETVKENINFEELN